MIMRKIPIVRIKTTLPVPHQESPKCRNMTLLRESHEWHDMILLVPG